MSRIESRWELKNEGGVRGQPQASGWLPRPPGLPPRWRTPGQLIDQGTALGLRPQKFLLASVVGQWAQGPGLVNEENERLEDQMPSY